MLTFEFASAVSLFVDGSASCVGGGVVGGGVVGEVGRGEIEDSSLLSGCSVLTVLTVLVLTVLETSLLPSTSLSDGRLGVLAALRGDMGPCSCWPSPTPLLSASLHRVYDSSVYHTFIVHFQRMA